MKASARACRRSSAPHRFSGLLVVQGFPLFTDDPTFQSHRKAIDGIVARVKSRTGSSVSVVESDEMLSMTMRQATRALTRVDTEPRGSSFWLTRTRTLQILGAYLPHDVGMLSMFYHNFLEFGSYLSGTMPYEGQAHVDVAGEFLSGGAAVLNSVFFEFEEKITPGCRRGFDLFDSTVTHFRDVSRDALSSSFT